MRRIFRPVVILLSAAFLAASCLGDDDTSDITYYSDTAITSFSLGTLNRTMYTKTSDGKRDSSYIGEVDGSEYKFYIDQAGRRIYNADSLPVRTDNAHVICNIGTKKGGLAVIEYKNTAGEDSLVYYDSTDSLDFSGAEPLRVRVYANDLENYRTYQISVNVHKENPDSMNWHYFDAYEPFTRLDGMKAVAFGGSGDAQDRLLLLGRSGGETVVYGIDADGRCGELSRISGGEAYATAVAKGDSVYATTGDGTIARSADGRAWDVVTVAGSVRPARLMAAGERRLYGTDADGRMVSSAQAGHGWTADGMAADADGLPTGSVSCGTFALKTYGEGERVVMIGNRATGSHPEDSVAMVWSKLEEYAENSERHSWMHVNENNGMQLPRLEGLAAAACGDVLVAIGGRGLGTSHAKAYSQIYVSQDNGLTWSEDGRFYLPAGFNGTGAAAAMAVDNKGFIWIICGGTGEVWRGRLNRMGWADQKTSFTE